MQHVKTNAASTGMENRRSQQMIQVHQHCCEQDEVVALPVLPVVKPGDESRKDQVEKIVNKGLQHAGKDKTQEWKLYLLKSGRTENYKVLLMPEKGGNGVQECQIPELSSI